MLSLRQDTTTKKRFFIVGAIVLVAGLMFVIALYAPSSLPVNADFSAIYYANLALVNRVPVYDIPAIEALALKGHEELADIFNLPRFPYPPWYTLTTFYLGLLPIEAAGTLWFEINLVMLFASVWLLTDGWMPRARLFAFPLALIFLPILGTLAVGQYGFPVMLGAALLTYALPRQNVLFSVLGLVLLTFKPHIGALAIFITLFHLISRKDDFSRNTIKAAVLSGAFLFIIGFIADPAWPVNYPNMLLTYQDQGNVTTCSECIGVPIWLSRTIFDGSLSTAVKISMLLLIGFGVLFVFIRHWVMKSPSSFISFSLLVTLLVSPYLYNYDFILLLPVLAFLFQTESRISSKVIASICYLLPLPVLALTGRNGNIVLVVVSLILLVAFLVQARDTIKDA